MHKKYFVYLILFLISFSLTAQSKVAVLDSTLGEGVPPNASAIVADTINEQFVKSPIFSALDRAYISRIQEEKNFQLSGNVKEEDIKEIGNTFGADFICIANVSLLGSTYTVSARMIEVETAEVYAQESHRVKGEIDTLFEIAETVGRKLVNDETQGLLISEPVAVVKQEERTAVVRPEPEKKSHALSDTVGHLVVSYMFTSYSGDEGNSGVDYYSLYEQDSKNNDLYGLNATNEHLAIDVHYMKPVAKYLYFSAGASYTRQRLDILDGAANYDMFSTFNPYIGFGAVISPVSFLQVYGGILGGVMFFVLGEEYDGSATDSYWVESGEMAYGFTLGVEVGATAFLGPVALDIRYVFSKSPTLEGDKIFPDTYDGDRSFGYHGFAIGVGFKIK